MIAEIFLQNRYNKGFRKGFDQGFAQGFREASLVMKGAQIQQAAWDAWNRRREQARAEGRVFTEPPPTLETTRDQRQLELQRQPSP